MIIRILKPGSENIHVIYNKMYNLSSYSNIVTVSLIRLITIISMYWHGKHRNPQFYCKEIREDGQGFSGSDYAYYKIIIDPL